MLQLEEQRITESEKMQAAAAMVTHAKSKDVGSSLASAPAATPSAAHLQAAAALTAHTAPGAPDPPSKQPAAPPAAHQRPSALFSSNNKKKKKKGAPPPAFCPPMNPWTSMVQAWPFQGP
jgi:hypothetical protein